MTKKQLKEYAISVDYPIELWRDGYSIRKIKLNIYNFFSRIAMYSAIGDFKDKQEARNKADKIAKDLEIDNIKI